MRILITGAAGFIGFHLAKYRLEKGDTVIGIDNLNDYYDVRLKLARLELLQQYPNFSFYQLDICDMEALNQVFKTEEPQRVVNLAAQAGVRYSLVNPQLYAQSNMLGFTNIVEACRQQKVEHLVYASTSSVYGANLSQPYKEGDAANHPLTIYAASKKANELIAHSYSNLFNLPTTGLRFFTVYGPWGRPDMAFFHSHAIFWLALPLIFTIMEKCSEILLILMILWRVFPGQSIRLQSRILTGPAIRPIRQAVLLPIGFIISAVVIQLTFWTMWKL